MSSLPTQVRISITKIEAAPPSAAIRVSYQMHIENSLFSGAVAGGETQRLDEELGLRLEQLIEQIRTKIEQDLGILPSADKELEEEEL